jgi:hypothetical protein
MLVATWPFFLAMVPARVVLEAYEGEDRGILSTHLFADGRFVSDLWMEKPSP